jgi:hypothetical protein
VAAPQGNTANFLNDANIPDAGALNILSDGIGAIADWAGAIAGLISLANDIFGSSSVSTQDLYNLIEAEAGAIIGDQRRQDLITQFDTISNALNSGGFGGPVAILQDLTNVQTLPVSDQIDHIEVCIGGINQLSAGNFDGTWMLSPLIPAYWTDAGVYETPYWLVITPPFSEWSISSIPLDRGYGQVTAPTDSTTGLVYYYVYILPAYLQALFIYTSVASVLLPEDYIANDTAGVIRDAVGRPSQGQPGFLVEQHDAIQNGIQALSPGYWDSGKLINWLEQNPFYPSNYYPIGANGAPEGVWQGLTPVINPAAAASLPPAPPGPLPALVPLPLQDFIAVNIEYGAVDRFGGASVLDAYSLSVQDLVGAAPGPDLFNKFQIRSLRRAKLVYSNIGLPGVWQFVNRLKNLVGDPPLPITSNFSFWSFRQLVVLSNISSSGGFYSLLSLAKFIKHTVPLDTNQSPSPTTSFNELLTH